MSIDNDLKLEPLEHYPEVYKLAESYDWIEEDKVAVVDTSNGYNVLYDEQESLAVLKPEFDSIEEIKEVLKNPEEADLGRWISYESKGRATIVSRDNKDAWVSADYAVSPPR